MISSSQWGSARGLSEIGSRDASDERYLSDDKPAKMATALIFTMKVAEFGGPKDPEQLAEFFADRMSQGGSVEKAEETEAVQIAGRDGAMKKIRGDLGGQKGLFTFAAVTGDEDLAILVGTDTTDGYLEEAINTHRPFDAVWGRWWWDRHPTLGGHPAKRDRSEDERFLGSVPRVFRWHRRGFRQTHLAVRRGSRLDRGLQSRTTRDSEHEGHRRAHLLLVKTKAGLNLRTWRTCWRGGRIQSVEQTKMEFGGR